MDREAEQRAQRGTVLSIMLSVMAGSLFLVFLFVACGGLWLYILAVVAGLAALGYLHYLLWGYSLSKQVTKEHQEEARAEAEEIPERLEAREWTPEERSWYKRF